MNAEQSPGFAVQRCPMLLPPLRGWPRSRMDIRTHVTGTQCSMFHSSFVPQAFTSPCFLQLCNVRGEPRWYGQWYPKSCLSSTGHHPTPPSSRLRFHCGQSEASDCTIRLCWLVHLEYRKSDSAPESYHSSSVTLCTNVCVKRCLQTAHPLASFSLETRSWPLTRRR